MPQQLLPYLNALKRWWWLVGVSVILACASAYLYWRSQPAIYQARTALMVGSSAQSLNPNPQQLGIERTLATFYGEMAKRQPITQAVVQRLGLLRSPEQLSEAIETRVVFAAQILEIYVYDTDPDRAVTLATAIAEELIRQSPAAAGQGDTREFVQNQLADLQQKIDDVDAQLVDLRDRMLTLTSASDLKEARATTQELEALRQNYSATYAQYLTALSNQSVNSLSIVELASTSGQPVSIGLMTTLLIAAAGGLALSIGAIALLEYTDNVLRWKDVVVENGLPILGVLPALPRRRDPLIIKSQPQSAEADAVRSLRTRIFLADSGAMIKRLLITSAAPRDGKSFATANLALAAAAAGLRVIIVDGDVRAGSIHQYFGCEREPGFTNLLWNLEAAGNNHLSLLRRTSIPNLQILPAGTYARDPLMLLRSARLTQLMEELSDRADLIFIDSPPMAAGPIASILSRAADAILLVASIDRTNRKLFNHARDELMKDPEAPLLGIALNRVSFGQLGAEYGSYYGYRYSYGQPAPPNGLLARLRRLPAGAFGRVARLLRLSPDGKRPRAASLQWLEDTPGDQLPEALAPQLQSVAVQAQAEGANARRDAPLLTVAEAAQELEVPEETIEEWCRTGQLPAVRIGRRWLVTGLARETPLSDDQ